MPNVKMKPRRANVEIGRVISSSFGPRNAMMNVHPFHLLISEAPVLLSDKTVASFIYQN